MVKTKRSTLHTIYNMTVIQQSVMQGSNDTHTPTHCYAGQRQQPGLAHRG